VSDRTAEAGEAITVELIGAAEVVDDLGDGAAALLVPDVLGQLVVAGFGAIVVAALGCAQVHA
jgi:hypothetical protein